MESGIPYGDIIVIGAIAAFIILRYRAMLGEQRGRDVSDVKPARPLEEYERVIQLPDREARAAAAEKIIDVKPEKDYGALNEAFAAMRAIDREFSPEEFLTGAKTAYEMVIEAYNDADHDTLKMLLTKDIYQQFANSLKVNAEAGRKPHTTLVAIVKADMTDAVLKGNVARITVDFLSEQIPLVRDEKGEIIEGNPAHQEAVEDDWVFERNLSSSDPTWKIIET